MITPNSEKQNSKALEFLNQKALDKAKAAKKVLSPDLEAGFHLLRQVQKSELQLALATLLGKHAEMATGLDSFVNVLGKRLPQRLAIHSSKGLEMITIGDILYLEAAKNYTDIYFIHQNTIKRITASLPLGRYSEHFKQYREFMKVHRSYIVNLMLVDQYLKSDHGLKMRNDKLVPVAKPYRNELENRLETF